MNNGPVLLKFSKFILDNKVITRVIPFNRLKYYDIDESLGRVLFRFDDYYTEVIIKEKNSNEFVEKFEANINQNKKIIEIDE